MTRAITAQALLRRGALGLDRAATCLAVLAAVVPSIVACRPQRPTVRDVGTAPPTSQGTRCTNIAFHRRGLKHLHIDHAGDLAALVSLGGYA
jgi:hypothetical protein